MHLPIALRFVALPALAMLAVVGLLFIATLAWVDRENERATEVRVEQRAALLADRVQRQLGGRMLQMRQLARQLGSTELPEPASLRRQIEWLQSQSEGYAWIGVVSLDGRVLAGTRGWLEGQSIAQRPVFSQALGRDFFGDFHPAVAMRPLLATPQDPQPSVADIGIPVFEREDRQVAVLAAHLDGRWLARSGDRIVSPQETTELGFNWALFSRDGQAVGRTPPVVMPLEDLKAQGVTGFDHAGVPYLAATRVLSLEGVPDMNWHAVVALNLDVAHQPQQAFKRSLAAVTLLSSLGVALAAWAMSRRLTRPYARLLDAVTQRHSSQGGDALPLGRYLDALSEQLVVQESGDADPAARLLSALSRDANQLRRLLDTLPMAVCLVGPDDRLLFASAGFGEMFGWPPSDAVGRPLHQLLPGLRRGAPEGWSAVTRVAHRDGRSLQVRSRAVALHDPAEPAGGRRDPRNFDGAGSDALVIEDITREAETFQRLQESQERFAAIIDSASDAIISTSVEGEVLLFNPAAERIFQVQAELQVGRPFEALLPPEARASHGGQLSAFAASGTSRRAMGAGRVRGLRADGQVLELEAAISQATVRGRKVLTAILRDVTGRMQAERQLADYQAQLADLAQRLLRQEKETTQQLAQSLHDDLGQTLTALRMLCEHQQQRLLADGMPRPTLDRLHGLIVDANQQVRNVLARLRPPLLDEQGLMSALDNELRQQRLRFSGVDLTLDGPDHARWPADVEYAAFMIAREAVGNALLHAGPDHVNVHLQATAEATLEGRRDGLVLSIRDDGRGIEGLVDIVRPGHLGLVGMRERAAAVRGRLQVESSPEQGSLIRFEWRPDDVPHPGGG